MSQPISIECSFYGSVSSSADSLGHNSEANRIVDAVCGSPKVSRQLYTFESRTPKSHLPEVTNSGSNAIGHNNANYTEPSLFNNIYNSVLPYINNSVVTDGFFSSFLTTKNPPFDNGHTDFLTPTDIQPFYNENIVKSVLSRNRLKPNEPLFKTSRLSDIEGFVFEFAKDQIGSRFIQQKLDTCTEQEKEMVFNEVLRNATLLVDDIFGNYVIQKLFEYGNQYHWQQLIFALKGNIFNYSKKVYACRVLQKALDRVDNNLKMEILSELRENILECMEDQNGNHVVQKAVEKVESDRIQFIIDALLKEQNTIYRMSVHTYGCRVIQRVLENCDGKQRRIIIQRILANFDEIVQHQYGNYVIQHVADYGTSEDMKVTVELVSRKLLQYSSQKYSSNAVEKCLINSTMQQKGIIVRAACSMSELNRPVIVLMMKDEYANYVAQRLFEIVSISQSYSLINIIRPHIAYIRQYQFGKPILARLEKFFQRAAHIVNLK